MRRLLVPIFVLVCLALGAPAANAYYSGQITPGNPLAGHRWFVDVARGAWYVALRAQPQAAAALRPLAHNPMSHTMGTYNQHPGADVAGYISRTQAEQPGSIPFVNVSRIEGTSCPYPGIPAGYSPAEIARWDNAFAHGIGNGRILVIIETDKLAAIECLPKAAQARRLRELAYEVHALHKYAPNSIVYIDAGSEDWHRSAATIAGRLKRANVAEAQGFALGASHYDWTYKEVGFGLKLSRLLNGKHFVVNTDSNGWGPRAHGSSWYSAHYHPGCVPPGEGIGIQPTVKTGHRNLDAFVWLGTPGYEAGDCLGLGGGYTFYLRLAVTLARNANPRP
jgi:endoglucanase